jgi:hypothetical protein
MNRISYFVGGLAALILVVLTLFVSNIKHSAAGMPSPSVAANPTSTSTPAADAASMAIDDLAAWPVAGTRK